MNLCVSVGRITDEWRRENILKEVVLAHRKYNGGVGLEKKNRKSPREISNTVTWPRIELGSSRVQAYRAVILKLLVFATHFGYSIFSHGTEQITLNHNLLYCYNWPKQIHLLHKKEII